MIKKALQTSLIVITIIVGSLSVAYGRAPKSLISDPGAFGVYTGWPDAIGIQYSIFGTFGPQSALRLGVGIPSFYNAFGMDFSGDALFKTDRLGQRGIMKLGGGVNIGYLNHENHFTANSNTFIYPHFLANFSMPLRSGITGFIEPEVGPIFVSQGYGMTAYVALKLGVNFKP